VIDTHAHLDALDDDPADVVARAREAGVTRILTVGTDVAGSRRALELAEQYEEVFAILGIHPHAAGDATDADVAEVRELLATDKPAVIHTRAADADTLSALAGFEGRVVLHCFSSPHLLDAALERGWYVSFAGNATFPKAVDLRLAARQVPAERILAETDAPYLAPQPKRGRPNEPAYVMYTLESLAQARNEDPRELEQQIDRNASECFRL